MKVNYKHSEIMTQVVARKNAITIRRQLRQRYRQWARYTVNFAITLGQLVNTH